MRCIKGRRAGGARAGYPLGPPAHVPPDPPMPAFISEATASCRALWLVTEADAEEIGRAHV